MATCRSCGGEYAADDLVRHEHDGVVVVHCPDCHAAMGRYDERGHR